MISLRLNQNQLKRNSEQFFNELVETYTPIIGNQEAEGYALLVIEHIWELERSEVLLGKELEIGFEQIEKLKNILIRIQTQEPIQYILGEAWFYGRKFKVNSSVLIPRPETEELVYWIKEQHSGKMRILDIGSGSGCIPITLSLEMALSEVYGLDISEAALQVAKQNTIDLEAKVEFKKCDILNEEIPFRDLDIIVSNPPYIRELEKEMMLPNVLDHEPHLALFVPDNDPLRFYKLIAEKAKKVLKPQGWLYFEINEAFGLATSEVLLSNGFSKIEIRKDMQGKDRMVKGMLL